MQSDDRLALFLLLLCTFLAAFNTYMLWTIFHALSPVLHLVGGG